MKLPLYRGYDVSACKRNLPCQSVVLEADTLHYLNQSFSVYSDPKLKMPGIQLEIFKVGLFNSQRNRIS